MALFGRRKAHENVENGETLETNDDLEDVNDTADADEVDEEAEASARKLRSRLRPRDEIDLSNGPFDAANLADDDERLDFGALRILPIDSLEMRLDVDEQTQVITGLTALFGQDNQAAVQLQAFAAPKSSGIWYGIRREIADALISSGGKAEEVDGPLGTELHVSMPNQGPDGRVTFAPARFVGVDGPRWFLRAVLSGQAAIEPAMTQQAMEFVRSVAVYRGGEARAPRELLELSIPQQLLDQVPGQGAASAEPEVAPLERGPEIAETR